MRVTTTSFGYLVWIVPEELGSEDAAAQIAKLKEHGKVAVLVSGRESLQGIIGKFAKVESMD